MLAMLKMSLVRISCNCGLCSGEYRPYIRSVYRTYKIGGFQSSVKAFVNYIGLNITMDLFLLI